MPSEPLTASRGPGPSCMLPLPPAVNNPWLMQHLADFLSLGGSATADFNGRLGVAVYYDLSAQFGMYRMDEFWFDQSR